MLLMLGVGLRLGSPAVIGMLVLIVVLQFVTAPVSAHLTVRVAYRHATDDQSSGEGADPLAAAAGGGLPGAPRAGGRDTAAPGARIGEQPAADDGPVEMAQALAEENALGNTDVDPDGAR